MKTRNHLWITALVALILALVILPGLTIAEEGFPQTPHLFYGTATIGGNPAPVGTVITAVVEGGGGSVTTTTAGKYSDKLDKPKLKVQPAAGSTIPDGAPITFFINGERAQGFDVDQGVSVESEPFTPGESTELNLQVSGSGPVTQFTISASAGINGAISPSGTTAVNQGADQSFTIAAATGFQVADVLVDGVSVGAVSSYTFTNVNANHTISVTFTEISGEQFIITASSGANGSISPSGPVTVTSGQNQSFIITPASGFQVDNVLVDGVSAGAVSSFTFTNVNGDHAISVTFNQTSGVQFIITASSGANGGISPSGPVTVTSGQNQSFIITPASGFQVADVLVDSASVGAVSSFTFTNVNANHTISASFSSIVPVNFTIDAKAGPNGKIDPSGLVQVVAGMDRTFTITPDEGFNITTVIVDGIAQGAVTNYTFSNVDDNHTISAYFAQGIQLNISVSLGEGWNIFSTPIRLEQHQSTIGEVFGSEALDNIELIYGWDGTEWFTPSVSYELQPLSALYIKARSPISITLTPSTKPTAPPSRNLVHGFSLIGIAPGYDRDAQEFPVMPLDQALTSIKELPGNMTGYVIVISPGLNQPAWTYNLAVSIPDMLPFKGYWVFMENEGEYGGFSTTPII